jgi:hypothetical protein
MSKNGSERPLLNYCTAITVADAKEQSKTVPVVRPLPVLSVSLFCRFSVATTRGLEPYYRYYHYGIFGLVIQLKPSCQNRY